jgi:hypothetical protein
MVDFTMSRQRGAARDTFAGAAPGMSGSLPLGWTNRRSTALHILLPSS